MDSVLASGITGEGTIPGQVPHFKQLVGGIPPHAVTERSGIGISLPANLDR
jgi:hypothetical protein